jgi:hypothetical protein
MSWADRFKKIASDHAQELERIRPESQERREEYELSRTGFIERRVWLEEHVKARHRVFVDLNADSVYVTQEDFEQTQTSPETRCARRK